MVVRADAAFALPALYEVLEQPAPFLRSGRTSTVKSFLATMGEAGLRSRDSPVEGQ